MKKKVLCLLLSTVMLVGSSITVFAADPVKEERTVEVTTDSSSASDAAYVIQAPASIELKRKGSGEDQFIYTADYTIGVKGVLPTNKYIEFKPKATTFEMTGANTSTKATATITQAVTIWEKYGESITSENATNISPSSFAETNGNISVPIVVADSYSGEMGFTIECKSK